MQITIKYDDILNEIAIYHGRHTFMVVVPTEVYHNLEYSSWIKSKNRLQTLLTYVVEKLYRTKVDPREPNPGAPFDHTCVVDYNDGKLKVTLDGTTVDAPITNEPKGNFKYADFDYSGLSRDCVRVLYLLLHNPPAEWDVQPEKGGKYDSDNNKV